MKGYIQSTLSFRGACLMPNMPGDDVSTERALLLWLAGGILQVSMDGRLVGNVVSMSQRRTLAAIEDSSSSDFSCKAAKSFRLPALGHTSAKNIFDGGVVKIADRPTRRAGANRKQAHTQISCPRAHLLALGLLTPHEPATLRPCCTAGQILSRIWIPSADLFLQSSIA